MRKYFICLLIIVGLCFGLQAHAQKAYDIISYKVDIYGSPGKLEVADGYLLASKVTIHSSYGDQIFAADANEPNDKGELKFHPEKGTGRYKNITGSWLRIMGSA